MITIQRRRQHQGGSEPARSALSLCWQVTAAFGWASNEVNLTNLRAIIERN
jgi:hypothetical protein